MLFQQPIVLDTILLFTLSSSYDFHGGLRLGESATFLKFILKSVHLSLNPRLRMHGVLYPPPQTALRPGA
jgi:hypothetical protein